jgi:hypothetical protein
LRTILAETLLAIHVVVIGFNVFGLIAVPSGMVRMALRCVCSGSARCTSHS